MCEVQQLSKYDVMRFVLKFLQEYRDTQIGNIDSAYAKELGLPRIQHLDYSENDDEKKEKHAMFKSFLLTVIWDLIVERVITPGTLKGNTYIEDIPFIHVSDQENFNRKLEEYDIN
ncbi:hypothetical protein [Anaerosinus massiliensis]|uniref:hypothetical protein n=1 Tax=Massilibacillus massiliensis TaxID=1806837 RepID=UPI000DA5F8EA|nr:hypothetical protein [Massilibacillus massiliensis]